jgi:hypothetical protein
MINFNDDDVKEITDVDLEELIEEGETNAQIITKGDLANAKGNPASTKYNPLDIDQYKGVTIEIGHGDSMEQYLIGGKGMPFMGNGVLYGVTPLMLARVDYDEEIVRIRPKTKKIIHPRRNLVASYLDEYDLGGKQNFLRLFDNCRKIEEGHYIMGIGKKSKEDVAFVTKKVLKMWRKKIK